MAEYDPIQIRRTTNTYPDLFQENYVGASSTDTERGWWPDIPVITKTVGNASVYRYFRVGPYLYFVGGFNAVGGVTRNNAACIDLRTNTLTDWDPNLNDLARALEYDGTYIYIGGCFTDVNNGTTRNRVCRVNKRTGVVDAWDPNMNDDVLTIVISGTRVFTCGHFTTVNGGTTRNRAAEFSTSSATVQATFDVDFNNSCLSMSYDEENKIMYFAGFFITADGGTTRNRAASWDTDGDALGSWDPNVNNICSMAKVINSDSIWVGGLFTTVNGAVTRNNLAEFNAAGTVTSPQLSLNNTVYEMQADEDGIGIYIGGAFTSVLSTARNRAAKLKLSDYTLEPWDPNITGSDVFTVFAFQSTVFYGGLFTTVGGNAHVATAAVTDPLFTDTNSLFISKSTGDDANAGTFAAPKKTINSVHDTTYSINDTSGSGHNLTETGTVHRITRYSAAHPRVGKYAAGPFTTTDYLSIPAGVGTAFGTANALTVEMYFYLRFFTTAMLWEYNTPSGVNRLVVNGDGSIGAYINSVAHNSATGLTEGLRWYHVAFTFDGTTKKIYLDGNLILNQAQTATVSGTTTSHVLGYNAVSVSNPVLGFIDRVRFYDAVKTSFPSTGTANLIGRYNFETDPAQKDISYTVIIDDEIYRETFETRHPLEEYGHRGLYAYYGKSPTLKMDRGAIVGTYGARASGRTKFSTGAAGTFYYVSKGGDDSTGARGNSALPFLTIQAALNDGSRINGDTVQIQDSGIYDEDLDLGAFNVTIQAADGQVPQIRAVDGTSSARMIVANSGTTVDLYGLTLIHKTASNNVIVYLDNNPSVIFDCTLLYGATGISGLGGGSGTTAHEIKNCLIINQANVLPGVPSAISIDAEDGSEIGNCFCGTAVSISSVTGDVFVSDMTVGDGSETSFLLARGGFPSGNGATQIVFENIVFDGPEVDLGTGGDTSIVGLRNCLADGGEFEADSLVPGAAIFFGNCISKDSSANGFEFPAVGSNTVSMLLQSCVAINPTTDGFQYDSITATIDTTFENCVSVNAGVNGLEANGGGGDVYVRGFIEKGSATNSIAETGSGTINVEDSVYEKATTGSLSEVNTVNADPLIINSIIGNENVALSAESEAIFFAGDFREFNAGLREALIDVRQDGFIVSGITFDGAENIYGGLIHTAKGISPENIVSYCTFKNLGPFGLYSASSVKVRRCLFRDVNGISICSNGPNSRIVQCVNSKSKSAFLISGAPLAEIENNSSYLAEFGQYDKNKAQAETQKNNVYIDSGIVDYSGIISQTHSDIGTLSDDASVDANSTRLDPLYRDRDGHDLRLGVIEAGFPFNSPAKEGGDNGNDMGAFAFFYGDTITTATTVDFATAGYRNPDVVVREHAHVRLVEDTREDASLRSKSIGVKRLWSFEWNSPNDMSSAQRQDLIDLFELENSEMDLSVDGGSSWTTVILKREDSILYQDEGGYVNDTLPLAVRRLVFREK